MLSVVIDTNVWIGSLLKGKVAQNIIKEVVANRLSLFVSDELLTEIVSTSRKSKFVNLIDPADRELTIDFINARAHFVKPREKINICRDLSDNMVLECANEARADCIITWDPDLIILNPFRTISIISPVDVLELLKKK